LHLAGESIWGGISQEGSFMPAVVSKLRIFGLMLELIDSICYKKPFPAQAALENLPLANNKNSHQCENCGMQLGKWVGHCPGWSGVLDIVGVFRPIYPFMVKFQSVTVAMEKQA
jgi:hypothetical protein